MNKKILYSLFFLFCLAQSLVAQHNNELYNNGAVFTIESGAEVHVLGDVHMRTATTLFQNYGLLVVQGNMYGDNLFQQRGTGTTRFQNSLANIGQAQSIISVGSGYFYAVRSSGSANKGIDDGSFYNLELANDQGILYLNGNGHLADVRNSVNFWYGATQNRIITNSSSLPANTSGYTATFGVMNPANTSGAQMTNNTVTLNGNMSTIDAGYIQGKFRQQVNPAGGIYNLIIGMEPAGTTAQKGMQYMNLNFGANTYDVFSAYYESGSDNTIPTFTLECSNYLIDYFGGIDHGEWILNEDAGGSGTYTARVWPQDHNMTSETVWMITQNDAVAGTADECGGSPVGLQRSGLTGLNAEIGVAGGTVFDPLPIELLSLTATPINDHTIKVKWSTATETNVDHFEIERSTDFISTTVVGTVSTLGNYITTQHYQLDDINCEKEQLYYYRVKTVDVDNSVSYSPFVSALITNQFNTTGTTTVYPNPVTSLLNLGYSSVVDQALVVTVFSALGQKVYSKEWNTIAGENLLQINTAELSGGVYFLELRTSQGESVSNTKLVK